MTVIRDLTLAQLLVVEDDASLLEFECPQTGLPLWPQIRIAFFRMLISDLLYGTAVTGMTTARIPAGRAALTLGRSVLQNLRFRLSGRCRAEVCMMGDGVADQWVDGKWFNRLGDHFALACPKQTLVIADHFEWRWPFPRHHDRIMFHAPQQALNSIAGRLMVRDVQRHQALRLVGIVSQRAQRHLGWSLGAGREHLLVQMLSLKSASLPSQYRAYQALLRRTRPRLLMIGAGCYGPAAGLIAAAKDEGIVTAEYQHGAVSAGHDAYNFAPAVRNSSAYRRTLPGHFLGYGTWWNDQINAPVAKTVIGNPHREARLAQRAGAGASREDILILSDGIEFALYLELARKIEPGATRKGLRVVLRPHPLERTLVETTHGRSIGKVLIDGNADLYASLQSAHAVVSEVSTGLFEAAGVADRIFIWDTPKAGFSYPNHPFQAFTSAETLMDQLDQSDSGRLAASASAAIWAPAWRENYLEFLRAQNVDCTH